MRLIDADKIKAEDFYDCVDMYECMEVINRQPTVEPQGIDKDRLIRDLNLNTNYGFYGEFTDGSEIAFTLRELIAIINQQPTTDVPDTNVGEIPQLYKDRVEHVIKVLEFCKQRHIDIVTDLPHTVEIERGTISAYSMALKVVRECLLQPYKENNDVL